MMSGLGDHMYRRLALLLVLALGAALPFAVGPARAQTTGDSAFFAQDWKLNPAASQVSLTSTKQKTVVETHVFTGLDGTVSPLGEARVEINLSSLATGIDLRDVRMRFLFFETFKFPAAFVTAQLDKAVLAGLTRGQPVSQALDVTLDLHGVKKVVPARVLVMRTGPGTVSVTSQEPIVIQAADFDLAEGVNRLSQAMANVEIVPEGRVTFNLLFEAAAGNQKLETVRSEAAAKKTEAETRALTAEECQTRMDVISKTRQIFFPTGSAEIKTSESAPVLDEVAQFLKRCSSVSLEISGHTDTDGAREFNQALSEQRARVVAAALAHRGVAVSRMVTVGYGFARPVADNGSEKGKAQNRRIEFSSRAR